MILNTLGKEFNVYVPGTVLKAVGNDSDGDWIFEGIASTSNLDLFDDVVYPESFANSVEFFKTKGVICYNHDYAKRDSSLEKSLFSKEELIELKSPIGNALDAKITPEGLYIKGKLNKAHPMARKMWNEFLNNPDESFRKNIGLSIGAKPMGQTVRRYSPEHGKHVNFLPDLLLYEVSLTTTPVNPHTSAWASVIKSLATLDGEDESMSKETIIQIEPQETLFDAANNRLVVKSVVENENGEIFVFEQYVDLSGKTLKAVEDATAPKEEEDPAAEGNPLDDAPVPGPDEGMDPAADPMADPAAGADPMADAGGAPAPDMGGAASMDPMAGGGAPDPMAAGAGDPSGMPDPLDGTSPDSSMALMMDKLDTVVEALSTLTSDLANLTQGSNLSVPSETQPPMESGQPNSALMKSIHAKMDRLGTAFELSTLSRENLTSVIKSAILEMLPTLASIDEAGNVVKSADVISPAVTLSTSLVNNAVIKSIDGKDVDYAAFKTLSDRYNSLVGRGVVGVQRARVASEAEATLGISGNEFVRLVNKHS